MTEKQANRVLAIYDEMCEEYFNHFARFIEAISCGDYDKAIKERKTTIEIATLSRPYYDLVVHAKKVLNK